MRGGLFSVGGGVEVGVGAGRLRAQGGNRDRQVGREGVSLGGGSNHGHEGGGRIAARHRIATACSADGGQGCHG